MFLYQICWLKTLESYSLEIYSKCVDFLCACVSDDSKKIKIVGKKTEKNLEKEYSIFFLIF